MDKVAMYLQSGFPNIYHNQLNIITEYLASIKLNIEMYNLKNQKYIQHILPTINTIKSYKKKKRLTRKIPKQQDKWSDWLASEQKQLNQYENQGMFGPSTPIPKGAKTLPFIWTYLIKIVKLKRHVV